MGDQQLHMSHLHLMLTLQLSGAFRSLLHTPSWHSWDNFTFFYMYDLQFLPLHVLQVKVKSKQMKFNVTQLLVH